MKSKRKISIIALFFTILSQVSGQKDTVILTLDEAVNKALEENPDIIIARNEADIAKNRATAGNAGLYPSLSLNGGYQVQINNTRMEFALPQQPPIDREGAQSSTLNASATLNYNIFGGLGKYYMYRSLKNLGTTGDLRARLTLEGTILQVMNTYLETARIKENVSINQLAVEVSFERLQRVKTKYVVGIANVLEVLNAKVELNTDSINLVNAIVTLQNMKRH